MKPSSFDYVRAHSLDDVLAAFAAHGDDAKILAGGQSLIPAMNMRLAAPGVLIDVAHVAELRGIDATGGLLRIGAMSRHAEVLSSPVVTQHAPLISKAMPHIAHATIRNRGTFGGSLCTADPASELPACAIATGAAFNILSPSGSRAVAAADFFVGTYATCLAEDELLVAVDVPVATASTLTFFDEMTRRRGDYAMAGLAAQTTLDGGRLRGTKLVFFGIGEKATEAVAAQALIDGKAPADVDAADVAAAIADEIQPFDDLTTSAAAKTVLMKTLARRALAAFADGSA